VSLYDPLVGVGDAGIDGMVALRIGADGVDGDGADADIIPMTMIGMMMNPMI
jgi:hypothetical protein